MTPALTTTPRQRRPGADEVLRVLSEPLRWRIVELLAHEQLCVCHLVDELAEAQPLVSHHLRVLREAGLLTYERHRYWTYYRLRPEALRSVASALTALARPERRTSRRRPCD